ncbi:MAG: holin [Coprococcus sp.]|uniref:holin n=1 Tax=Coprococcus catus TaxID=116085 RepID=UPI001C02D328|nr:holin [Coprococcus catus]MBT9774561.1 hypothetical protein [Coprococcus catus]
MFKNCVFKNSVDTRKWMVNAGIRAVKTMAQTAVAVMGTSTVLSAIDWRMVLSSAVVAGIVSLLTSVAGLPEAPCEGISSEEAKK